MGFHLPLIFAILSLAAVALANHAAQPAPQLYWNSVLPNTQMPRSISELLHPDSTNEEKSTNIVNAVGDGKNKRSYSLSNYGKRPPPSVGDGKSKRSYSLSNYGK
ncbi:PREDICTED: BURP, partial [Prunus dulcis]